MVKVLNAGIKKPDLIRLSQASELRLNRVNVIGLWDGSERVYILRVQLWGDQPGDDRPFLTQRGDERIFKTSEAAVSLCDQVGASQVNINLVNNTIQRYLKATHHQAGL